MANPRKKKVVQQVQFGLSEDIQLNLVRMYVEGVRNMNRAIPAHMKYLAELLAVDAIPPQERIKTFEKLGELGQNAVINSYDRRPYRPRTGSYRKGDNPRTQRLAGGKLRRALKSKQFYTATADGLQFINTRVLNQEAQQWRRLNFGAGAAAGDGPGRFPISFLQASVGLEPDPRPAFLLPPGFWLRNGEVVPPGPRGTAQFYPYGGPGGRGRARLTRGIEAQNFLDAGIKRIGKEFGPQFEDLYDRFYKDRKARLAGAEKLGVVRLPPITKKNRIY